MLSISNINQYLLIIMNEYSFNSDSAERHSLRLLGGLKYTKFDIINVFISKIIVFFLNNTKVHIKNTLGSKLWKGI